MLRSAVSEEGTAMTSDEAAPGGNIAEWMPAPEDFPGPSLVVFEVPRT
jgi:hypothetical protein